MTKEALAELNTNTLIGQTAHRGTAWHYREGLQGEESNHYAGPVPVEDVRRRLFDWAADSRPLAVELPADVGDMTHLDEFGHPMKWSTVQGRQAIVRSDTGGVMGIFANGYERHQYDEWLLDSVANLLDADLSISSAGLLKNGAIAWVEVGIAESLSTPEGIDYRPNLLATTSFDGSIATTYKSTVTAVVCDNTRAAALGEAGAELKVKHSRNSRLKLAEARQALEIVHTTSEQFEAQVRQLANTPVRPIDWDRFLTSWAPTRDQAGRQLEGRALTMAAAKRERLDQLYRADRRAAPWRGTALGVLQAVNTFEHHDSIVRGSTRTERNMLRTVAGDFDKLDQSCWRQLERLLVS